MPSTPVPDLAEFDIRSDINPDAAPDLFAPAQQSFLWGYWRKADGEITAAPNWPTEYMQHIEMGWTSLRRYGEFVLQQAGWNVNREPYRMLFANGGAKEFGQAQIVSHNWHRRPPYKGVTFPQLDRTLIADATCKFCRKTFSSWHETPDEAQAVVDGNLARHESVSHKDNAQNAGLARALKEGLLDPKQAAGLSTTDLTALVQQMADTQSAILKLLAQREEPYLPPKPTPPGVKR